MSEIGELKVRMRQFSLGAPINRQILNRLGMSIFQSPDRHPAHVQLPTPLDNLERVGGRPTPLFQAIKRVVSFDASCQSGDLFNPEILGFLFNVHTIDFFLHYREIQIQENYFPEIISLCPLDAYNLLYDLNRFAQKIDRTPTMNINTQPILDFFDQLIGMKDRPPIEEVLTQLAKYFDADGIGVTVLNGVQTNIAQAFRDTSLAHTYPWQTDADLLKRLHTTLHGVAYQDASGEWLVGLAWAPSEGEELLVWLYRRGQRGWAAPAFEVWPFVGQILVRWLQRDGGQVQSKKMLCHKLEQAALVTSRLCHDFGNHLTGILGFTELSIPLIPTEGSLPRFLQEVLQAARHGSDWIKRLQWFCRRGGGNFWPSELSSLLDNAQIGPGPGSLLTWEKNVPEDLPLLAIEATSLKTLLAELANNAHEAAKGHGAVTFTARAVDLTEADCRELVGNAQAGRFVEIAVEDDGPGFSNDALGKLFQEPFFSTKTRQRGLGLMMSYGILHRFHGGLTLTSRASNPIAV